MVSFMKKPVNGGIPAKFNISKGLGGVKNNGKEMMIYINK